MRLLQHAAAKNLTFVRLEPQDFREVRSFVLRTCERLENPAFFITSDIDSVLPGLLVAGHGLVYGAIVGGDIVATQAVDYHAADRIAVRPPIQELLPERYLESGWTMVAMPHRCQGIARRLGDRLENDAHLETNCDCWIATVHPRNRASLRLYFGWGYIGYDLMEHFGVLRMVLIKGIGSPLSEHHPEAGDELVSPDDCSAQSTLFSRGYACLGFEPCEESHLLQFARLSW